MIKVGGGLEEMIKGGQLYTSTIPFQSFIDSGCSIPKLRWFMSMRFTYLDSKLKRYRKDLLPKRYVI